MPRAPRKCPTPGCENRITGTRYCPRHTVAHWANGPSRTSTAAHQVWAKAVLKRDRHQCQVRGPQCQGTGTIADHIIPVAEEGAEYDIRNGQAICSACHKTKTQDEATRGLRRAYGHHDEDQDTSAPF